MKSLYFLVDFLTVIIPFVFSFHPKIKFNKTWNSFFIAVIPVAIFFIFWDIVFTTLEVWHFNSRYLSGIYFFNLPLEEILFFICIPYSCVFTFYCLDKFYNLKWNPKAEKLFFTFFCLILLLIGLVYYNRIYTSVTLISTALISIILKFILKVDWLGKAVSVYAVLLIPFLIVNGILTGTGLPEAVVKYNNSENLNIRILTIPVEDIFYGFELFILNLSIYIPLVKRKTK